MYCTIALQTIVSRLPAVGRARMIEDGISDELWGSPDENLSNTTVTNHCDDNFSIIGRRRRRKSRVCVDATFFAAGKDAVCAGQGQSPDTCEAAQISQQTTTFCGDTSIIPMPSNSDSASSENLQSTSFSESTKRKRQGLHGKQATAAQLKPQFFYIKSNILE